MNDNQFVKAKAICQSRFPFSEIRKAYAIKGYILKEMGNRTIRSDGKKTDVKIVALQPII
jgi:hypothetical protein